MRTTVDVRQRARRRFQEGERADQELQPHGEPRAAIAHRHSVASAMLRRGVVQADPQRFSRSSRRFHRTPNGCPTWSRIWAAHPADDARRAFRANRNGPARWPLKWPASSRTWPRASVIIRVDSSLPPIVNSRGGTVVLSLVSNAIQKLRSGQAERWSKSPRTRARPAPSQFATTAGHSKFDQAAIFRPLLPGALAPDGELGVSGTGLGRRSWRNACRTGRVDRMPVDAR